MLNYASFCISAALRGLFFSRPDVVIATSPQLLVGLSGWWLARWKRVPFVFEVRDLWPESLAAVGVGEENSLLHRVAGEDRRISLSPRRPHRSGHSRFQRSPDRALARAREKIAVVENGVETDLFAPAPFAEAISSHSAKGTRRRRKICRLLHRHHGNGARLETLLDAACQLQRHESRESFFLMLGEGAEKERIKLWPRARPEQSHFSISSRAKKFPPSSQRPTPAWFCSRKPMSSRPSFPPRCWNSCRAPAR